MRLRRLSTNVVILASLLWISTGCYVPLHMDVPESRKLMSIKSNEFVAGETSRADVLLAMGEPDETSADESVLTYRFISNEGFVAVTQCTGVRIDREMDVSYSFDGQGILRETNVTVGKPEYQSI